MKTRSVVVTRPGKVEIKEYQLPALDKNDMLAKLDMAGICGTDLNKLFNPLSSPLEPEAKYPFFIGHEWSGTIVEMGNDFPKVDPLGNRLKVGDGIIVYHYRWACGECYFCKYLGQPNLCSREHATSSSVPQIRSAFSDFQYISGKATVYKIPDYIPLEVSVLTEPVASSLRAFERSFVADAPGQFQGMISGKVVAIQGSGPIGMILVALSKLYGAWRTIVIGAPDFRLRICRELGADYTINIDEVKNPEERIEIVKKMTPHRLGVDICIEAAGVPSAFAEAIELVRRGGTLVEVGHYTNRGVTKINPLNLCWKDINLFGSWGCGPTYFGLALKIMDAHFKKLSFEKIVTHKFSLDNIVKALEVARNKMCGKVVVLPGKVQ